MEIFQLSEERAVQRNLQFRHSRIEVMSVNGQRLRRTAAEIAQDQIVRGLFFNKDDGLALRFNAQFDHG